MVVNNACKSCNNKNCEYREFAVKDYSIYTTENCCKQNVEVAREVIETKQFKDFESMLKEFSSSESLELFKSQLTHFKAIAINELIIK